MKKVIQKIIDFLFSGLMMGLLLVIFGLSIAYATFIENDFGSATAKLLIYNARWFEFLYLLMIINFSGMIVTKKLYRRSKWNVLVMHVSLMVIILGAAVTRYFGFEGQMHIRNGQTSDLFVSTDSYVYAMLETKKSKKIIYEKVLLAPLNKKLYERSKRIDDQKLLVRIDRYYHNVTPVIRPVEDGQPVLSLVTASQLGRKDYFLKNNETIELQGWKISLGDSLDLKNIQFISREGKLFMRAPFPVHQSHMGVENKPDLPAGVFHEAHMMQIYSMEDLTFVISQFSANAVLDYQPSEKSGGEGTNLVMATLRSGQEEKNITLKTSDFEVVELNGIKVTLNIGPQNWRLPFSLKLNKFELERYPGSRSPSSFASDILLIDQENNLEKPYRIYMNNILSYHGYRFYQSSYDQDEKGTILSVNHDYWGTILTYVGYGLLFLSLILSLFTKNTRFASLSSHIKSIHEERKKMILLIPVLFLLTALPDFGLAAGKKDKIDPVQAKNFGKLLVQNKDGRIIPMNTLASNLLVKIYKKDHYRGSNSDQVLLEMLMDPENWKNEKMIKIYDQRLQELLRIKGEFASLNSFFDANGNYLIKRQVDAAYQKSPALRSTFEKELMNVDERVNVALMIFQGSLLRIFPIPDHTENKWATETEINNLKKHSQEIPLDTVLSTYLQFLAEAGISNDYSTATQALNSIKNFQRTFGQEIIPDSSKINLEVLYNKINIFKNLFPFYMTLGFILLGLFLIQLFRTNMEFPGIHRIIYWILMLAFGLQTSGLIIRWYISGHAPWSNGYESMIYIAWASMLAGILFYKKSPVTLSLTSILAGITLLTAHMSWLNPEITNLVPVLKSYWLTFHVATITASYGFFGLGSLMGFVSLIILIFRNKENLKRFNLTLDELTSTIEMALMIGLILLTIGNFLGGIWANESWGRYWGWDPKETWSLVTIIVYAFILHLRLIPDLRNVFTVNFGALIGFGSVLMTYFGVNYYLSGLHSYAQGDPVPIPKFVYVVIFIILIISVFALRNELKFSNKTEGAGMD